MYVNIIEFVYSIQFSCLQLNLLAAAISWVWNFLARIQWSSAIDALNTFPPKMYRISQFPARANVKRKRNYKNTCASLHRFERNEALSDQYP